MHAGGDATGAEVQRALHAAVTADPGITLVEHAMVLDLVTDAAGRAAGVTLHVLGEGTADGVGAVRSRAVVLATGGMGQVYSATTNPSVSTGDGVALGLRAGAVATDLEFVQFHPTALYLGPDSRGQQPLVSEALRGEGALLRDAAGERFMVGVHPLAELAPRDVVAKAITRVQLRDGTDHVLLDARHVEGLADRFPTIVARCREAGIDPVAELVPVTPAAHYASGGLATDLTGRTTVPGLYACGEVACTGVHGANRLASNSLLEGLVFAGRIGAALAAELSVPEAVRPAVAQLDGLLDPAARGRLTATMSTRVGALRSGAGLARAAGELSDIAGSLGTTEPGVPAWEATDLLTVATAITAAAGAREETRGCHWREDHPDAEDGLAGAPGRTAAPRRLAGPQPAPGGHAAAGALVTAGHPGDPRDLTGTGLDGGLGDRPGRAHPGRGPHRWVPAAARPRPGRRARRHQRGHRAGHPARHRRPGRPGRRRGRRAAGRRPGVRPARPVRVDHRPGRPTATWCGAGTCC